jgi:uncharacterized cupin superfamily protein
MHEARIEDADGRRVPVSDGWFILNVRDLPWWAVEGGGTWCDFESPNARSSQLGIGIQVLAAGEAPGFYHEESNQEGFLVLSGECIAIVEGEERRMGPWDYFHCPPRTRHIIVGTGREPCALLMVGTRSPHQRIRYTVEPAAARHGRSVEADTDDPRIVYRDRAPFVPAAGPAFPPPP